MKLRLENIRKEYDEKVAVENLSLEVPEGKIFGIIGPNGAGKTTTIRMIMNITMPDSGRILIDGAPPAKDFKNRVGYLPEERGLYKKMTLKEIITYMAELKGFKINNFSETADPWLERLDLLDYKKSKVEELSKGMQQKLQFITTIIHEPEMIILDEIFSGLDPINMEKIKDIILDLKRSGKTILFSTHVMEQAEKLCDNICMISKGQKVIDGRLSDVKAQFGKNCIQVDMEGDGAFMSSLPGVKSISEFNNYIELNLESDTNTDNILKSICDKVSVKRFEIIEPSLYDIFLDKANIDSSQYDHKNGEANV